MGFDGSKFALSKQKKERKNEVTEKESHTLHLAIGGAAGVSIAGNVWIIARKECYQLYGFCGVNAL